MNCKLFCSGFLGKHQASHFGRQMVLAGADGTVTLGVQCSCDRFHGPDHWPGKKCLLLQAVASRENDTFLWGHRTIFLCGGGCLRLGGGGAVELILFQVISHPWQGLKLCHETPGFGITGQGRAMPLFLQPGLGKDMHSG